MLTTKKLGSASRTLVLLLFLLILGTANPGLANNLGTGAQARTRGPVNIQVNPPDFFNWKSRADILAMRSRAVAKHSSSLLSDKYEPDQGIFHAIEDGKPWWGIAGSAVYGPGQKAIIGTAEESRYVLNPYLLVGVAPAACGMWDTRRLSERDMEDPKFPFYWEPQSIQLDASKSMESVVYNITSYNSKSAATGKALPGSTPFQFSLVAYNARDFGFNYIWLNERASTRVTNDNSTNEAVQIVQFIHCGGSCGYPGNCNNMSPYMASIDRCRFTGLPARAAVYLWRDEPSSVAQKPDMVVYIDFY